MQTDTRHTRFQVALPSPQGHRAADGSLPSARRGSIALAALVLVACGTEVAPMTGTPLGDPASAADESGATADTIGIAGAGAPVSPTASGAGDRPGADPTDPAAPTSSGDEASAPVEDAPFQPAEPVGCVTDVTAGEHVFNCEDLVHVVSVPDACLEHACGLVLDIHGGTMSANMEDKNTGARALGAERDFIVVQPNAVGGVWRPNVDDPKVFAFAQSVVQAFHVNEKRIHAMGFSQGGYMSWRFVCAHSDWLASAAPAAAAGAVALVMEVGCTFAGTDKPAHEIPLLYMHGTKDALVNFQNGVTLRDAVRAEWGMDDEEEVSSSAGHRWTRYTNERGNVFEFIQHEYSTDSAVGLPPLGVAIVGHCYPGSHDLAATEPFQLMAFACKDDAAFTWGEAAMDFFVAHPKP